MSGAPGAPSDGTQELPWARYAAKPRVQVIGLGGAGSEALIDLIQMGLPAGIDTLAVNTDGRHLESLPLKEKILLGEGTLRGRGSGGDRQIVRHLGEDSRHEFLERVRPYDVNFLLAGLGGGTGSALLPLLMDTTRRVGSLAIPVAFLPFRVELESNPSRRDNTLSTLRELERQPGLLVLLANERLRRYENQPLKRVLTLRNAYVHMLTLSVVDMVENPSEINLDLGHLHRHVRGAGLSTLLVSEGDVADPDRLFQQAVREGLLELDLRRPGPTLLHVEGGCNLTLAGLHRILAAFRRGLRDPPEFAFGARIHREPRNHVRVTAIVGGLGRSEVERSLEASGSMT
jgi:cell division protein FtsZ